MDNENEVDNELEENQDLWMKNLRIFEANDIIYKLKYSIEAIYE